MLSLDKIKVTDMPVRTCNVRGCAETLGIQATLVITVIRSVGSHRKQAEYNAVRELWMDCYLDLLGPIRELYDAALAGSKEDLLRDRIRERAQRVLDMLDFDKQPNAPKREV